MRARISNQQSTGESNLWGTVFVHKFQNDGLSQEENKCIIRAPHHSRKYRNVCESNIYSKFPKL